MRLQDQIILVTGSTTGIGEFMARRFVAEGAKVILHGRNAERGAALRTELGEENAAFCQGDLGDADYPEQLARDALAVHGRIDALVNNAGLVTRSKIEQTDAEFFDRIDAIIGRVRNIILTSMREMISAKRSRSTTWIFCLGSSAGSDIEPPAFLIYSFLPMY